MLRNLETTINIQLWTVETIYDGVLRGQCQPIIQVVRHMHRFVRAVSNLYAFHNTQKKQQQT